MSGAATADVAEALHELRDAVARLDSKLEARFDRLDSKIETVRSDVLADITHLDGKIEAFRGETAARFDAVRAEAHGDSVRLGERLDRLTGQIIAKMPSLWQLPAVIGASAAVLAALYAAAQFLRLHGWWPG